MANRMTKSATVLAGLFAAAAAGAQEGPDLSSADRVALFKAAGAWTP